ncbi:MAG: hypothetical protein VW963_11215 [Candidatus Neomarinimicrobiota bacterium]
MKILVMGLPGSYFYIRGRQEHQPDTMDIYLVVEYCERFWGVN